MAIFCFLKRAPAGWLSAMYGLAFFLQAFVAVSIFFGLGARHSHIAEEFKPSKLPRCKLPNWLRDFLAN